MHAQKEERDVGKLATVMWTLRCHWNQMQVKKEDFPISQVVPFALQALQDFFNANSTAQAPLVTKFPSHLRWSPPPLSALKANFDRATFKDIEKASLGVVIRNGHGQVLASLSKQIHLLSHQIWWKLWLQLELRPLLWRLVYPQLSLKVMHKLRSRFSTVRRKASHHLVTSVP